MYSEIISW